MKKMMCPNWLTCIQSTLQDARCGHRRIHNRHAHCRKITMECPYPCIEVEVENEEDDMPRLDKL